MLTNSNSNRAINESTKENIRVRLEKNFEDVLTNMGFHNWKNIPNMRDTPSRMAKMYVNELLKGCYTEAPEMTAFPNEQGINSMIVLGPIRVNSLCSHHFVPFIGEAHVGYIPKENITGISKLARIVDWYSRRPQIQEELGEQISNHLYEVLQPLGVGVHIKAQHGCMQIRGIQEPNAWMTTMSLKGVFLEELKVREEFLSYIKRG
jgi:GTP cyclohydrolase I